MRFSELLKEKITPMPAFPRALPPSQKEKKISPEPSKQAPPRRDELEKEIRSHIQSEFEMRLKEKEREALSLYDQKIKDMESRMLEREKRSGEERSRMELYLSEIKNNYEMLLSQTRMSLEAEFQKKLEIERKNRSQSSDNDSVSLQELLRKYQNKIHDLENRLQAKELELYQSQSKPSPAPEPKAERYGPPPVHEITSPQKSQPLASFGTSFQSRAHYLEVDEGQCKSDAERLYCDMSKASKIIFDQVLEGKNFQLEQVKKLVKEVADLLVKSDTEIIRLCLQPYQEGDYFIDHSVNVVFLSLVLGLDYNFNREEMHDLGMAALFHDIALTSIQENLNYPKQLTPNIQKEVLDHPEKGAELLRGIISDTAVLAISQHHESNSGKGYPKALEGKEIHPFAKIIHTVDSFEALIHERPYRQKPLEINVAMKEMIETGRGEYDGLALKALIGRVGLYPVGTFVELSNRQIGSVIRQNRESPLSPVVRIEYDEWGSRIKTAALFDLSKHHLVHIVGPVTDTLSYGKARIQQNAEALVAPKEHPLASFIPMILVLIVLSLLVYVVLKI